MKKKTNTTFVGMLLAIGALTTPVYPGGLVKQLPVDGTWAEYTATVELAKGEQKMEAAGILRISSIGTQVHENRVCRWIEITLKMDHTGLIVAKLLTPEIELEGGDPLTNRIRGWIRMGNDKEVTELVDDRLGPLNIWMAPPLKERKVLEPIDVNSALGTKQCSGEFGIVEFVDSGNQSRAILLVRNHQEAPFGTVFADVSVRVNREGNLIQSGELTFTLKAMGDNAKTILPNQNVVDSRSGTADEKNAAARFTAIHNEWKTADDALNELIKGFPDAPEQRREALRKEYEQQAQHAKELRPRLRDAALAAYRETPNGSDAVTTVLVSLAAFDVFQDNYVSAAEVTVLLTEHNCDDTELEKLAGVVAYCRNDFVTAEKLFRSAKEKGTISKQASFYLSKIEQTKKLWNAEQELRVREARADDLPRVEMKTNKGTLVIELFENEAPKTVANFISLVEKGFYDGVTFHRVLPNFMAQGGCPDGDGKGGPGYKIPCECHTEDFRGHFAGTLSMAHAGRDTGGSQFFLVFRPTPHLDGKHTVFGRVIEGMEFLSQLQRIDPQKPSPNVNRDKIVKAAVLRKRDHAYEPSKEESPD